MPLKCVAIDDEPPALVLLREYISKNSALQLIQTFEDAISGGEYLRANPADLLFIDISMPDISGLDLVRSLPRRPLVIFTTAHKQFAIDGFELDAVDYLIKPISRERFDRAVQKAADFAVYRNLSKKEESGFLFVFSEYRMLKIPLAEIEYIESLEDYIRIHLLTGKPVMTLMTLKKVLENLPAGQFKRIHRSYIVATDKVKSILNRKATLLSAVQLPISDSYTDFIEEWKKR